MKKKNQEILISRVMIMLLGCAAMAVLSYVYYLPQKMQTYVVSNYRDIIEIVTKCVCSLLLLVSLVYKWLSRKKDFSGKVITPDMVAIITLFCAIFSFVIPMSGDRGTYSRVSMMVSVFVFISYTVYYFVNRSFAFQSAVAACYFVLIYLYDKYYSANVTFNEKIALEHNTARLLFALVIVAIVLISVLISKKCSLFKVWHTALLSMVPAAMLVARFFVFDFVGIISLVLLCVILVAEIAVTKLYKKR